MRLRPLHVAKLLILIWSTAPVFATELQPGVEYRGKTQLSSPEYGSSFVLPAGWVGVLPPDGEFFVMRSRNFEAYVFAGIDEMTVAQAKQVMSNQIDLGDGILLSPKGAVSVEGSKLQGTYHVRGSENPLVGRITTIVGDHGLGVSFMAAAQPQDAAKLESAVNEMVASLKLTKPKKPSAGTSSGPLVSQLSGRKLSYFYTKTGYTEEHYIWLCPDNRFFTSRSAGGFGGGASGAFLSENGGTWSVNGNLDQGQLVLSFNGGRTSTYNVTLQGSKLKLDGSRYFREATNCN